VARRRDASDADAGVDLWKRDDGLVDLVGRALSPADAIACSDRLDLLVQPAGPDDERTAGQRRQGALVDLILGRTALPFDEGAGQPAAGCCPPGSLGPCGAQIFVHVPIATAAGLAGVAGVAGVGAEPAELVGHGPIDHALLADLLANAPVLRRVWIDADTGVPVAVDDRTWTPDHDPALLARALAEMRTGPPPDQQHPIHPGDHAGPPTTTASSADRASASGGQSPPYPRVLSRPHLADPGGYVPPRRLKQLVRARAPRCEWPGCGRRASPTAAAACDLDHDLAWPYGPTCACNLGPLCRRHHRIKQTGWTKNRRPDGSIRWTDPTGRTWTSPKQHSPGVIGPREPSWQQLRPGVWALAA
jgi:hypothetical protein